MNAVAKRRSADGHLERPRRDCKVRAGNSRRAKPDRSIATLSPQKIFVFILRHSDRTEPLVLRMARIGFGIWVGSAVVAFAILMTFLSLVSVARGGHWRSALVAGFGTATAVAASIATRQRLSAREGSVFNDTVAPASARLSGDDTVSEWPPDGIPTLDGALVAASREGIIVVDADGRTHRINPQAAELFGLSSHQVASLLSGGRPPRVTDLVRAPALISAVAECFRIGLPQDFAFEDSMRNDAKVAGTVRPIAVDQSVPHADPPTTHAAPRFVAIQIVDQSKIRESVSMRRDLIANLSHELKTPLAAIKGYAETIDLALDDDPEAARHFMSQIHDQCGRLEHLVADMLQLARAQSEDSLLQNVLVSLTDVIDLSVAASRVLADQKRITITRSGIREADIYADQEACLTIVNNLLSNAIRYTGAGGEVFVGVRENASHWIIYVRDTGIGIAREDQQKIFKRFVRVERIGRYSSIAEREGRSEAMSDHAPPSSGSISARGGTGIGLSVVRTLTRRLGGHIRLESELGQGSTFEVWLPRRSSDGQLLGDGKKVDDSVIFDSADDRIPGDITDRG